MVSFEKGREKLLRGLNFSMMRFSRLLKKIVGLKFFRSCHDFSPQFCHLRYSINLRCPDKVNPICITIATFTFRAKSHRLGHVSNVNSFSLLSLAETLYRKRCINASMRSKLDGAPLSCGHQRVKAPSLRQQTANENGH